MIITIIGAESTGKTTLAESLAKQYNTIWVPEIAREYVEKLDREYTYKDVLNIAHSQVETEDKYAPKANDILFVDTDLIITKIWFDKVYNHYPKWIDTLLQNYKNTYYLLCKPDIPWIADSVRENGGEARIELFDLYKEEIEKLDCQFGEVGGMDNLRIENAKTHIESFL